jgi:hypothetical protein
VTLLRTASSFQHSLLTVYTEVKDDPTRLDPKYRPMIDQFVTDHEAAAKMFEALTVAAGGGAWTCGNSRFDSAIVAPAFTRIVKGEPAKADAKEVPPSDNIKRDILNLLHGLESVSASTYQAMVVGLSKPDLRAKAITVAAREARHSALLAITINPDRPGGYVDDSDLTQAAVQPPATTVLQTQNSAVQANGNTTTTAAAAAPSGGNTPTAIPTVTAIPSQFGSTSALQIVVGAGDENGTRLKVNLETPSLNSYTYEYLTPSC